MTKHRNAPVSAPTVEAPVRQRPAGPDLQWKTTGTAWLAGLPGSLDGRGDPVEADVPRGVRLLCDQLLGMGGSSVCVPCAMVDVIWLAIAERGTIFPSRRLSLRQGEPHQCHANSALVWSRARKTRRIATGFGLTDDAMWRHHSWIMEGGGRIIETTAPVRDVYFGLLMDEEGSRLFHNCFGYGSPIAANAGP